MAFITRKGDVTTGHEDYPSRPSIRGSEWVYESNTPIVTIGHSYAVHCNSLPSCHGGVQSSGSIFVFIDGKAIGRIGDSVSCGDFVATGSNWIDIAV